MNGRCVGCGLLWVTEIETIAVSFGESVLCWLWHKVRFRDVRSIDGAGTTDLSSLKNWVGDTESRYKAHRTFERIVILEVTRREPLR